VKETVTTAIETESAMSVTAEWSLERDGGTPGLVVTLDLGDLEGVGGVDSWQFDGVVDVGSEVGTDLTLRYIPNG
jgi:hypothetical protein